MTKPWTLRTRTVVSLSDIIKNAPAEDQQHIKNGAQLTRYDSEQQYIEIAVARAADLPALARQRLAALGIQQIYGNDGSPDWCTVSNPLRFFSHRRDRVSGRFAASIWRT